MTYSPQIPLVMYYRYIIILIIGCILTTSHIIVSNLMKCIYFVNIHIISAVITLKSLVLLLLLLYRITIVIGVYHIINIYSYSSYFICHAELSKSCKSRFDRNTSQLPPPHRPTTVYHVITSSYKCAMSHVTESSID